MIEYTPVSFTLNPGLGLFSLLASQTQMFSSILWQFSYSLANTYSYLPFDHFLYCNMAFLAAASVLLTALCRAEPACAQAQRERKSNEHERIWTTSAPAAGWSAAMRTQTRPLSGPCTSLFAGAVGVLLLRAASFVWAFPTVAIWGGGNEPAALPAIFALVARLRPITSLDAARQADALGLHGPRADRR